MNTQPESLMTGADYAAARGLAKQTIYRQIASGKIPTRGRDASGRHLIDPVEADAARPRNIDPEKQFASSHARPQSRTDDDSYSELKKQALAEDLARKKRENEEALAILVRRDTVARRIDEIFSELRARLLQLPVRIAPRLVAIRSEREMVAAIEDALNVLLAETADNLDPPGDAPVAG